MTDSFIQLLRTLGPPVVDVEPAIESIQQGPRTGARFLVLDTVTQIVAGVDRSDRLALIDHYADWCATPARQVA